ncbi:DUF3545 family protein [Thalassotalea profundi]|uniref:DUF3545 family protein n=1 Tax=Thalassotalea profundi TaxID=2036687 RepID=A0ABQ3IH63_9GAMM|nr:DUF3545 family protein [Thalassotalea profundi]GHE84402.1 hypothetical protein GCM10011501_11370 [Thalassotalea profundi]
MDKIDELLNSLGTPAKTGSTNNKKRKWREIEQLKEKFQLERELKAYEDSLDYMLEDF